MRKRKEGGPSSSHHIKGARLCARTAEQAKKTTGRALALLQEKNGLANAPLIENSRKALIDMRKMRSSTQPIQGAWALKPALLNKHLD